MKNRRQPTIALVLISLFWLLGPPPAGGDAGVIFDLLKAYSIYQKGRVLFGGKQVAKEIGRSMDRAVRKQFGVNEDGNLNAWVSSIFSRVKAQTPPDYDYTCTVIKADFVNAMALPGGYIYVTVPLLELITTDDQLAGVMGHEIAHVVENHGMDMAKRNIALGTLIETALKDNAEYRDEVNLMYNLFMLSYSRDNEYEADVEGVDITAAAGYNPLGMVEFLKLMLGEEEKQKNRPMEWLSTHPTTEGRILKVKKEIYLKHNDLSKPMYLSYAEGIRRRQPANLIPNGGFEVMTGEAGVPAGWTIRYGTGRGYSRDCYLGESSLQIGGQSASTAVACERFELAPDTTYTFRGYMKSERGGSVSVHLACFDKEGRMQELGILPTVARNAGRGWDMLTGRLKHPPPPDTSSTGKTRRTKQRENRRHGGGHRPPPDERPATGETIEVFTVPGECSHLQVTLVVTAPLATPLLLDELSLQETAPASEDAAHHPGLIRNGGFELDLNRDRQPDGWRLRPGITVSRSPVFDGYTSLRFDGREISSPLAQKLAEYRHRTYNTPLGGEEITLTAPPVPVTEDLDYLIGIHSLGGETTETFEVRAEVLDTKGEIIEGAGGAMVFSSRRYWQQHCLALRGLGIPAFLKLPANRKPALVRLMVRSKLRPDSTIWFDSVYMRETDKPPRANKIMFTTTGP